MTSRRSAMRPCRKLPCALLFTALIGMSVLTAHATPRVVVSIAPVHALVAAVMDGVGVPVLLIPPGRSPHSYALRPSQRRHIDSAQLLIWIGANLEPFLVKPLADKGASATVIELLAQDSVRLVKSPAPGVAAHHRSHENTINAAHNNPVVQGGGKRAPGSLAHSHSHDRDAGNPHVWLDPVNAIAIVTLTARALGELDPSSRAQYAQNARHTIDEIHALDQQIKKMFEGVRDVPYVVFHDAFTAFEQHYGLNRVAAIADVSARMPGTRRVQEIRRMLERGGVSCVFSEPQQQPRVLGALTQGLAIRRGVLNPLGTEPVPGTNAWLQLMHTLATDLYACLAAR
jgi:zinc transport system substrate-binding protein